MRLKRAVARTRLLQVKMEVPVRKVFRFVDSLWDARGSVISWFAVMSLDCKVTVGLKYRSW